MVVCCVTEIDDNNVDDVTALGIEETSLRLVAVSNVNEDGT